VTGPSLGETQLPTATGPSLVDPVRPTDGDPPTDGSGRPALVEYSPRSSLRTSRRIGIFGGTFDPPHIGHLIAAQEAHVATGLDTVVFVPAADPPHKAGVPMAPAHHRTAMVELAIRGNPAFTLGRYDVDRPGPHFTVDLLDVVRRDVDEEDTLFFIVGADSLVDLPHWRDPGGIVARAPLIVCRRPGYEPDLEVLEAAVPGVTGRIQFVDMPLIGISGSDIERRIGEGRPIRYQVTDAVEAYIRAHGLYGAVVHG
jgi:nicotinate-nucleotide adenylyltransferase